MFDEPYELIGQPTRKEPDEPESWEKVLQERHPAASSLTESNA
jgi:hypothetical protein